MHQAPSLQELLQALFGQHPRQWLVLQVVDLQRESSSKARHAQVFYALVLLPSSDVRIFRMPCSARVRHVGDGRQKSCIWLSQAPVLRTAMHVAAVRVFMGPRIHPSPDEVLGAESFSIPHPAAASSCSLSHASLVIECQGTC